MFIYFIYLFTSGVAENDLDHNCVEKALYTLSIFQNAAAEVKYCFFPFELFESI